MANALNLHEGKSQRPFTTEVVQRDGFGPDPACAILVGELGDQVVGYALFLPGYNSDLAARALFLVDLFVVETARGHGVGRALMAAVAAEAVRRGASCMLWGVRTANSEARAFYRRIGARDEDARILELHGPTFSALAAEGLTSPRPDPIQPERDRQLPA